MTPTNYWTFNECYNRWINSLSKKEITEPIAWSRFYDFIINHNYITVLDTNEFKYELNEFRNNSLNLIRLKNGYYLDPIHQWALKNEYASRIKVPTGGDALRWVGITDSFKIDGGRWITNFVVNDRKEIECKWLNKANRDIITWAEAINAIKDKKRAVIEVKHHCDYDKSWILYDEFGKIKDEYAKIRSRVKANNVEWVLKEVLSYVNK